MTRGTIIDRIMIDQRPKVVEKKNRIGDLDIDTVVGKEHKGFLVTVVDRKSKISLKQLQVTMVKSLLIISKYQLHLMQSSTLQILITLGKEDSMNICPERSEEIPLGCEWSNTSIFA